MKIVMEVFYLRIVGQNVCYQHKLVDLSKKGTDPDKFIPSLIQQNWKSLKVK